MPLDLLETRLKAPRFLRTTGQAGDLRVRAIGLSFSFENHLASLLNCCLEVEFMAALSGIENSKSCLI